MDKNNLKRIDSIKDWQPKHLDVVSAIFVATLLISNITAQKLFHIGPVIFTAGILVFPLSYIFGDILTEVYGFNKARRVIYLGFILNIFMALVLWISIQLPPAPGWNFQNEYSIVHSVVPRIVLASVTAYLAGELINSLIMSKLKLKTSGKHLWIRLVASTAAGQFVDSFLFVLIAFAGSVSVSLLIVACLSAWLFKTFYEIFVTPLTYIFVLKLKKIEGVDHFDKNDRIRII